MLDLNLGIIVISSDSSSSDEEDINDNNNEKGDNQNDMVMKKAENYYLQAGEASRTQMEKDSTAASNSSIIITEEGLTNPGDENSNNSSAFIFDILRQKNKDANTAINAFKEARQHLDLTTHRSFPEETGLDLNLQPGFQPITSPTTRPQWLKLSQVESSAAEAELSHLQQKWKSRRGPNSRSSQYIGVTFYKKTGKWESHIWDCGKQVYLGEYDTALSAARAYDRAAIKFRGIDTDINFNLSDYEEDMEQMRNQSKEEFVHILRGKNTGLARIAQNTEV